MKVQIFANTKCALGEGLHWNSKRQSLIWVDIFKNILFEKKNNEELKKYAMPCMVSATLEHKDVSLVYLVTEIGIATFNLDSNFFECIVPFDLSNTLFRTNDAGVDPCGNIVFGIMKRIPDQHSGSLYKVEYKKIKKILENIGIPNSIRWNIHNDIFYIADSYEQEMYTYDYNGHTIMKNSKKIFFSLKGLHSTPDGSTVSSDGLLWNAHWDGFCVKAYNCFGNNIHTITLPVPRPTSCIFGGDDNKCLFITTARTGLTNEQLKKYPKSGAVFMLKTHYSGCNSIVSTI